jgi:hypothetical protein
LSLLVILSSRDKAGRQQRKGLKQVRLGFSLVERPASNFSGEPFV